MLDRTLAYGRALYYPHINFRDENWIKTAALYYEGLNRIVPENYLTNDAEIIAQLNEREEFIRNINPRHQAEEIAHDFLEFARQELIDKKRRIKLLRSLNNAVEFAKPFSIHMYKMGYILKQELPELGLAVRKKERGQEEWYEFDPLTGAMYMACLANSLAQKQMLPVVTDNPAFQPLIRGVQLQKYKGQQDISHSLASMVIRSVVPEKIANIPIKKIIQFREKHNDERHLFYNEINKLVKDLGQVDNEDALKDCLEQRKRDIEIAVKGLKKSFLGMKISSTTALLGVSIPSIAKGQGPVIAGGGLIAVALGTLMVQGIGYYNSKNNSPYSYVLTLKNRLRSQTFAEQLFSGKIIL